MISSIFIKFLNKKLWFFSKRGFALEKKRNETKFWAAYTELLSSGALCCGIGSKYSPNITTKDEGRVRREGKCRKDYVLAHAYVAKKGRWVWRGNTTTSALYNYFGKWRPGNVSWSGLCLTYKPITVVKNRKRKMILKQLLKWQWLLN